MKLPFLFRTLILILSLAEVASSQYTPDSGSAERKAILNALRASVQRELKKPVTFTYVQLKVKDNWAVVDVATPANPDLSEFDYRGSVSKYAKCINRGGDDCGDPQYSAILKRTGSRWSVVKFGSGATDVWIGHACSKVRGCPKELQ